MAKFRKKPVVIEATQWFRNGDHPKDKSIGKPLSEGEVVRRYRRPELNGQNKCSQCSCIMHDHGWIDTIEGGHIVCPGDWIITGIIGEMYPCKPDIFKKTYEPVED